LFCERRKAEPLSWLYTSVNDIGNTSSPLIFDVAHEGDATATSHRVVDAKGRLDILVNNLGAHDRRPLKAFDSG
jgi:NADP-dependent 3-hydroxy acid dehydrogenase YdfG